MNARVFLVILCTAVFMAIWDADQKAMNAALAKKHAPQHAIEQVVLTNRLPTNLADGTWQVISQSGETLRITIDRSVAQAASHVFAEEAMEECFCISSTPQGDRWCFVRSYTETACTNRRAITEFFTPVKR